MKYLNLTLFIIAMLLVFLTVQDGIQFKQEQSNKRIEQIRGSVGR